MRGWPAPACRVRSWLLLVLLLPAACGGGGGGGDGPPPRGGGSPASFETREYRRSGGLGAIGASSAYARGATGRGVQVAVIDTGVDLDHPELDGQISPASIDILSGEADAVDDPDGHGTAVAGVIAAERNGGLGHGVAYHGRILAIRADSVDSCNTICGFTEADVAAATDYAVEHGAPVINYSLGGAGGAGPGLRNSLARAAQSGALLVFAAGNGGRAAPGYPARLVDEASLQGQGIAVGAVDGSGQIAVFSDRAGPVADHYLVAPGVDLLVPALGGGAKRVSGTSFAAPHVAGAAALVLDAAPHLDGAQVAELLLETARDLGEPGTDPVYGRGLVDLAEALRPQGNLTIPLGRSAGGPAAVLEGSKLALGQAFGPAGGLPPAVFLDIYGRPYWTALDQQVSSGRRQAGAERWLAARPGRQVSLPIGPGSWLHLALSPADTPDPLRSYDPERPAEPLSLTLAGERRSLSFGRGGVGLGDWFGLQALAAGTASDLIGGDLLVPPHLALLDEAESLAVRQALGADWWLGVGLAQGSAADGEFSGDRLAAVEMVYRPPGQAGLALQIGRLEETGGPLSTRGEGAFRLGGALTSFVAASGYLPLPGGPTLFGQLGYGRTEVTDRGGLLRDFTTLHSVGAAAGVRFEDVVRNGDGLAISVAQPLRVMDGDAILDRPVGRRIDGTILRNRERLDLAPHGHEVDLELAYRLPLEGDTVLGLNWLTRLQPGHDPEAGAVHLATVRVVRRF